MWAEKSTPRRVLALFVNTPNAFNGSPYFIRGISINPLQLLHSYSTVTYQYVFAVSPTKSMCHTPLAPSRVNTDFSIQDIFLSITVHTVSLVLNPRSIECGFLVHNLLTAFRSRTEFPSAEQDLQRIAPSTLSLQSLYFFLFIILSVWLSLEWQISCFCSSAIASFNWGIDCRDVLDNRMIICFWLCLQPLQISARLKEHRVIIYILRLLNLIRYVLLAIWLCCCFFYVCNWSLMLLYNWRNVRCVARLGLHPCIV